VLNYTWPEKLAGGKPFELISTLLNYKENEVL